MRKQELANQTSENATLRAESEASHEPENSLNRTIERLRAEISAKEARSKTLQDKIQVSRGAQAGTRSVSNEYARSHSLISHFLKKRMGKLEMRCQALQVRFKDQSASLKLARESHGAVQVHLDLNRLLVQWCPMCLLSPGTLDHSQDRPCTRTGKVRECRGKMCILIIRPL